MALSRKQGNRGILLVTLFPCHPVSPVSLFPCFPVSLSPSLPNPLNSYKTYCTLQVNCGIFICIHIVLRLFYSLIIDFVWPKKLQREMKMNSDYPKGMLSFLYNVMNISALNEQFRADPMSVMNSFGLSDDDQKAISDYNQNNVEGVLAALKTELIADRMAFW